MDELELLKKDWKNKEKDLPKLSYNEIYNMLWKRSSSLVKWIFYISIFEFVLYVALPFIFPGFYKNQAEQMEQLHVKLFSDIITYSAYVVLIFFMGWFFYNYKRISATDNVKQLMKTILNTRKSVRYYVFYNLVVVGLFAVIIFIAQVNYDPNIIQAIEKANENGKATLFWVMIIGLMILTVVVMIGLMWLFYQLLYGILLRKLKKNYKELEQIEI